MIGFSVFYYFVVFLPDKEEAKANLEREKQRKIEQQAEQTERYRDACIAVAESNYENLFEINSTDNGDGTREWRSANIRDSVERKLKDEKDDCFQQYPIK